MESRPAHIAIVDDHALFLRGIEHLLAHYPGALEVLTFPSGLDLLDAVDNGLQFDLVITDLAMKTINGIALIHALRQRLISVPVIVLSASEDAVTRANAEQIGAFCFLHKSVDQALLFDTIAEALTTRPLAARAMRKAASGLGEDAEGMEQVLVPQLGAQQLRILAMLAGGARNAEIAEHLNISENTVKTHLKAIFRALGVNTRTAAVQRGRELVLF